MKRSDLLWGAAVGFAAASIPRSTIASTSRAGAAPLTPPAEGVPVAFLLADGAVMIDFGGPWEVFQDAQVPTLTHPAFIPYTVAETTQPIGVSAGAQLVPKYDLATAPAPKVVVVPGLGISQPTPGMTRWLHNVARNADVMMSVCTGAFILAGAGLLDGHSVTTHHGSFATMAMTYPKLRIKRGARFVDEGRIATAAGLSAGIDLALHIVQRYYGYEAARQTAYYMEYQGQGWLNGNSNAAYAKPPAPRPGFALCPVCWMNVDPKNAATSMFKGKHYYFCMTMHKQAFDAAPQRFLAANS